MRLVSVCFALVVLSFTFGATARAQSLQDNEHYQAFRSWAIDTQLPDPRAQHQGEVVRRRAEERPVLMLSWQHSRTASSRGLLAPSLLTLLYDFAYIRKRA